MKVQHREEIIKRLPTADEVGLRLAALVLGGDEHAVAEVIVCDITRIPEHMSDEECELLARLYGVIGAALGRGVDGLTADEKAVLAAFRNGGFSAAVRSLCDIEDKRCGVLRVEPARRAA